jgi:hypothetical protein
LARWITDLDDNRFEVRERAAGELEKAGASAVGALRKALENRPTLEVRQRATQIVAKQSQLSPERLRQLRAVEVLEHIGTLEARQILKTLAAGAPKARLTQEAEASLDRLAKRPVPGP